MGANIHHHFFNYSFASVGWALDSRQQKTSSETIGDYYVRNTCGGDYWIRRLLLHSVARCRDCNIRNRKNFRVIPNSGALACRVIRRCDDRSRTCISCNSPPLDWLPQPSGRGFFKNCAGCFLAWMALHLSLFMRPQAAAPGGSFSSVLIVQPRIVRFKCFFCWGSLQLFLREPCRLLLEFPVIFIFPLVNSALRRQHWTSFWRSLDPPFPAALPEFNLRQP